ncbi:unnamed protein product [Danaus chrysippus]|uniref:(African queen) hypothetical protein n=1 Tax=Danaus chrysippus TaxID=151541 RepID=A0A8J2R4U2_9NEOP|nr:unnamed protein product [Danaus chrysippus]
MTKDLPATTNVEEQRGSTSVDLLNIEKECSSHSLNVKSAEESRETDIIDTQNVSETSKEETNIEEESVESPAINVEVPQAGIVETEPSETNVINNEELAQTVLPSAPVILEPEAVISSQIIEVTKESIKPKILCVPLEEAVKIFGGREIAEVRALSEREEAFVEAGPKQNPDDPLVDLLSTFRSSLIAVERERNRITCGYIEEEKSRSTLWKVEKRNVVLTERCGCGTNVSLRASYDVAELMKERLPAARLRLESLLREVQETYCHHQNAALLAHYDIEELLSEVVQDSKDKMREALALIFQAMRLVDGVPDSFVQALQRWAGILATALLETNDMANLLFLMHYLFRQTRSVLWATSVIYLRVWDVGSVAQLLALLEIMLTRPSLEEAVECIEEGEAWEEVDEVGEGGAVGEGRLREKDLLAFLEALPLRDMLARLLLFKRQDLNQETEDAWGDRSGGRDVLKACFGTRTLLHVFQRATHTHNTYTRLHAHMRHLVVVLLNALAGLHLHSCSYYIKELEVKISVELEACFAAGFVLLGNEVDKLPATLLRGVVAKEYCVAFMTGLHDSSPHKVESLLLEIVGLPCDVHVRVVTQAAVERVLDHALATSVLEFLFQTGMKPRQVACKGVCVTTSRQLMPELLTAHPRLHTTAFYMLADAYQVAPNTSSMQAVSPGSWRPSPAALSSVLEQWELKCPSRIPSLLLKLDYTPHVGLSLETQLCVGSWLCSRGEAPEWSWEVLRKLRVHRTQWGLPFDAPTYEPHDLLSKAFALMAGDWGHCIPLICGPGAEALFELSQLRPLDAVHCLGPIMMVMTQSPESISLTPKFSEIFSVIFNHGAYFLPYLFRRPCPAEKALQTLVMEQMGNAGPGWPMVSCWLHALWSPKVPAQSRHILDRGVILSRAWTALDEHVKGRLQLQNAKDYISDAVKHAAEAPVVCESVLRNLHAMELANPAHKRLMEELERQRTAGEKIHVDNAMKTVGWCLPSQELSIYRCCRGVKASGPQHPAHLLLTRLMMHIYLQRYRPNSPPVGTLYFSGLIHTRLYLLQIKDKLQEFATYHKNQANSLKPPEDTVHNEQTISQKVSPIVDNSLFPALKIKDLVAQNSIEEKYENNEPIDNSSEGIMKENQDKINLISYHMAVEKLFRQYVLWLNEGDKVRAGPQHADIATVLSEQALDAAWRSFLKTTPESPPPSPTTEKVSTEHLTHFERTVKALRTVKNGMKDRSRSSLPAALNDSYFKNSHMLYELLDSNINALKNVTDQWCNDVSRVCSLDGQLWELVKVLRVPRTLPPIRQSCSHCHSNVVVTISEDEWCVSCGAAQGIIENRRSFRSSLRGLARPRPSAAKAAAILRSMARRVQSPPLALGVCTRAWAAVPAVERYGPAVDALASLVESLVTKFLCRDIDTCLRLLSSWCEGSSVQQRLCGSLLSSARQQHCARLYQAVLDLPLPPHVTFSFLSKFDLQSWSETVDSSRRSELLESILKAAEKCGPAPDTEYLVLLEQLCVHSLSVVRSSELCRHVSRVMSATVHGRLAPHACAMIPAAVQRCADVDFDQLGNLLRDIGSMWWTARSSRVLRNSERVQYSLYAVHVADILYQLTHAFVESAIKCSYTPERVSRYAWSATVESWSPWLSPHPCLPLLPQQTTDHSNMLTRFTDTIVMIMHLCPGSEQHLLRHAFDWTAHTYLLMEPHWPDESRLLMTSLMTSLTDLPWTLQWFHIDSLQLALQICSNPRADVVSWLCHTLQATSGECWLRGVQQTQQHLEAALDGLLALFTARELQLPTECYKSVCILPWWLLPQPSLESSLRKFFEEHHSPHTPYHEAPQFKALLSACFLFPAVPSAGSLQCPPTVAHVRRCLLVSEWTRAACSPTLDAHVSGYCDHVLNVITDIAPHIEQYEGEVEELLSRAIVIMCVEPAAASAISVWQSRVRSWPLPLVLSCSSACPSLITPEYFSSLADTVAKRVMEQASNGWSLLAARWSSCVWWGLGALLQRGAAHLGYALHRAGAAGLKDALTALGGGALHLSENEEIAAVWICVAFRVIMREREEEEGGEGSCREEARRMLGRWSERKRSLIQLVTRHVDADWPTDRLQLLSRLALYIISPSEESLSSYVSAHTSVSASGVPAVPDRSPTSVAFAAAALYPLKKAYFTEELDMAKRLT